MLISGFYLAVNSVRRKINRHLPFNQNVLVTKAVSRLSRDDGFLFYNK